VKVCPTCGKEVKGRYYYQHVKQHDPSAWKHECVYCGHRSLSKYKMLEHVNVAHTGDEPFACDKCDRKDKIKQITTHILSPNLGRD
jgi:DNA-directed RNA polymerase subunit RPC12/RpoP